MNLPNDTISYNEVDWITMARNSDSVLYQCNEKNMEISANDFSSIILKTNGTWMSKLYAFSNDSGEKEAKANAQDTR